MTSSASTNSVMTVMMTEQPVMEPGDVVHHRRGRFLQLVFPRRRLPQFGERRSAGVTSATPATANPSNRRPVWPFDIFMPLALP